MWLRRCLWSSQLGLTFSNDLSEHGPGTPTMRAHSATVLRHTTHARPADSARARVARSQIYHEEGSALLGVALSLLEVGGSPSSPASAASGDEVQHVGPCGQRPGMCGCRCPQLPVCTCNPLTAALRSTRCCRELRGRRALSPTSRPRWRACLRSPSSPFSTMRRSSCSPAGCCRSLRGGMELRGGGCGGGGGAIARRIAPGGSGAPPGRLRRLWR